MKRRSMLYGGVAAAAGLAGAGVAWWKIQPHQLAPEQGHADHDAGADSFWSLSFDTPDGKSLAMSSFRGKPLLVNFWATWCPPCIEELPLLDSFYKTNKAKNWRVLGLAVDQPSAVLKWLQAKPLGFAVGMAGLSGTDLSKSLGNLSGSLPFTVVFDASGQLLHRKTGKVSPEDLAQWVRT
ncbi:TlpA family protein disulfide reductase [Polaromonas sp.]|uniref:TlpA family protein disulfide reductase n=1 Tax=Polaromonas sp. TaxID=1869339 RepID=UPI003BA88514